MSALVYGLVVYKESTYAMILGPDGEVVAQRRMPNEEALAGARSKRHGFPHC